MRYSRATDACVFSVRRVPPWLPCPVRGMEAIEPSRGGAVLRAPAPALSLQGPWAWPPKQAPAYYAPPQAYAPPQQYYAPPR